MNDEIKEILDELDWYIKQPNNQDINGEYEPPMELSQEEAKDIYNCITNLQQELNEYKFPNCKTKDIEVVRANLVDMMRKNKRLEQENEKFKTALEESNNVSIEKYNKLKLEKEGLQLKLSVIKDYKSRCEKASAELQLGINSYNNGGSRTGLFECMRVSKNILQNGSDSE